MPIPGIKEPAIPFGSVVVISGVSGFIGSHVADQVLAAGYRVRGTTRSVARSAWEEDYFRKKYGPDAFELVEVPDMEPDNAFDGVVVGASGFIHVANDMTDSKNPAVSISRAVHGALNALKASAREPGMRRFVYTSSSYAATLPKPGEEFTITTDTYNDEAVEQAWKPDADRHVIYAASKTAAERAVFEWVEENNPPFTVNAVLPNCNIGPLISAAHQGYPTTARFVKGLWDGDYEALKGNPPEHFVNVQDVARLHVVGLVNPDVRGERIFAATAPFNFNSIIEVLRKLASEREWKDFPDYGVDLSTFEPVKKSEQLLKEAYGVGFVGLEESVKGNAADLLAAGK